MARRDPLTGTGDKRALLAASSIRDTLAGRRCSGIFHLWIIVWSSGRRSLAAALSSRVVMDVVLGICDAESTTANTRVDRLIVFIKL